MSALAEGQCPRCGGIKDEYRVGPGYPRPGALSRADNETVICTPCGLDEGSRWFSGTMIPRDEWADRT